MQQHTSSGVRKKSTTSQLNINEGQHLLDSQINDTAMILDDDDLEGLINVEAPLTTVNSNNTLQWSTNQRELPNVPLPNIPLRTNQQIHIMPETQAAINLTNQQMTNQMNVPMNLQNPNYLSQRILPSTMTYGGWR